VKNIFHKKNNRERERDAWVTRHKNYSTTSWHSRTCKWATWVDHSAFIEREIERALNYSENRNHSDVPWWKQHISSCPRAERKGISMTNKSMWFFQNSSQSISSESKRERKKFPNDSRPRQFELAFVFITAAWCFLDVATHKSYAKRCSLCFVMCLMAIQGINHRRLDT
jgi:hypothetical protein